MIERIIHRPDGEPSSERIYISEFKANFEKILEENAEVELRGRVTNLRRFKSISFGVLQDQSDQTQITFCNEEVPNAMEMAKKINTGDTVSVTGHAFVSNTQEQSLSVEELEVVSRFNGFYPDRFKGVQNIGTRRYNFPLQLITDRDSFALFDRISKVNTSLRDSLNGLGFKEFETPILRKRFQSGQAKPFITHQNSNGLDMYMRPTGELELVQLIVAGYERVYEMGKAFRNEGQDRLHNPEYSTLEAYAAYSDYNGMMDLAEFLIKEAVTKAFGSAHFVIDGNELNIDSKWPQITVDEGFKKYGGFSLKDITNLESIEKAAAENGIKLSGLPIAQEVGKLIEKIIVPKLINPTFLKDFPAELAPLGKNAQYDTSKVERAWACINGIGIADIATNVVNPLELQMKLDEQDKVMGSPKRDHSNDPLVTALNYGAPPTAGLGIGINRLMMIIGDQKSLRDTIAFPDI